MPGTFGPANTLARSGVLSVEDWAWWRANNDRCDAADLNAATIDSSLFDKSQNPQVPCWLKATAGHLITILLLLLVDHLRFVTDICVAGPDLEGILP
ncbi:hypothetical protein JOE65_001331 [Arthrobacter roseus]|nr:hypothetical protein [Arthrobacter roseus]